MASVLDSTALVTLAQLKAYLGPEFTGTTWDAALEGIINSVSVMFDGYVKRTLAKTTYTNLYLDGNGQETLWLPNWPIVSITSIYEDDTLLVEGEDYDYYPDSGELIRLDGVWFKGKKTVLITYAAGYIVQGGTAGTGETALPKDIVHACFMQSAREWKKTQGSAWGVNSQSFPDGSITRFEGGLLKEVKEILDHYTRYGI